MNWKLAIAGVAMAVALAPAAVRADTISDVEGARAKERQGAYLSGQDVEQLRRYGGNDDLYGYGSYGPPVYGGAYYDDGYSYGPSVGIHIGD